MKDAVSCEKEYIKAYIKVLISELETSRKYFYMNIYWACNYTFEMHTKN